MSKVVRFHEHGGPEQLRIEELDVGDPGMEPVVVLLVIPGPSLRGTLSAGNPLWPPCSGNIGGSSEYL